MKKGKVLVLGTMVGAAIGTIAGILFAPKEGSKTRKEIKDKSGDYASVITVKLNEFRDLLSGKRRSAEREARKLAKAGKVKYDDFKKEVKNAEADLKHSVS